MSPVLSPQCSDGPARARTLARIDRRRRPERRLLGMLALGMRYADRGLIKMAVDTALAWPEASDSQSARKAELLFAMTAWLARAAYTDLAMQVAPLIPFAPGKTQVLIFTAEQQRFCWRVTSAYALVDGRQPAYLPVDSLIQPFQHGRVEIDDAYLRRVLLPRHHEPHPILLLPHPLGLVQLYGATYVILDGNHRVVCAWYQNRGWIPGFVLTPEEGAAVLISHSQWPPYPRHLSTDLTDYADYAQPA
jgi:hypothetical protein